MSVYGYQRDTTPNLSRFLADHPNAVRYEYAFSPASWTVPSHASLLTGLLPSQHRASGQGVAAAVDSALYTIPLAADITLAEVMHEAGYCTAAVLANANLLRTDGLERGFEAYFQPSGVRRLRLLGERLRRALIPAAYAGIKPFPLGDLISENVLRLRSECEPRPGFLVVNYMDAHSPYLAPPPHANLFAGTGVPQRPLLDPVLSDPPELIALKRDRYDEAIHHLDAELGRLFSALDRAGGMEDSWLFITSDHGNAFREHGTMAHGSSIYNEQVRIPLLVKPPAGIRLDAASGPVSLVDVATTVAAIGGRQGFGVGRDLSGPPDPHHSVWLQFGGRARSGPELGESSEYPARGVIQGRWKLIERSGSEEELYDVVDDPEERLNRSSEHADLRRRLEAALPPPLDGQDDETASPGQRLGLDDEEQLRALGYLR
jgi:arylsulfatase A-like enzyme